MGCTGAASFNEDSGISATAGARSIVLGDQCNAFVICLLAVAYAGVPLPSLAVETTDSLQPSLSLDEIVARMTVADSERHNGLNGYSVVRKYTLYNQRVSKTAEIVVRLEYGKHEGKRFEIVSSVEADGISGRVLHRLMETEAEASKKDAISDQSKVNPQNYNFDFLGMESKGGRDLYVLALRPKMKSKYLLRGTAWVDSKEFAITRIEGRPTASLSFWAGKPFIAMDFEKVDGFWLVAHNHSHAEGKLLGATDLTIDCSQYEVKGIGQTALGTITISDGTDAVLNGDSRFSTKCLF